MQQATVLLVEDNPADVLLMKRAMQKALVRCSLQVVTHGEAAIDYFLGSAIYGDRTAYPLPVLTLLDLKLPRRSGLEVLVWLRQQVHFANLPIVMVTASDASNELDPLFAVGISGLINKPVIYHKLIEVLQPLSDLQILAT